MYIIGLTGGIASGKSTVVSMLREFGAAIVDCDLVAREVVEPGSAALPRIAEAFGEKALQPDGTMNRAYIGSVVFSDPNKKKELEDIMFPYIHQRIDEKIRYFKEIEERTFVFLDMPLLFEVKYQSYVHEIWLIYVDKATQLTRLMARNGYTEDEALARIHSQLDNEQKKALSQVIIDNSGTLDATQTQVQHQWDALQTRLQER